MIGNKKIVCIIPARLASTRFPQKMLISFLGKPLLQWVWEAAHKVTIFDEIIFAIDAQETAQLIQSFGGKYLMTSPRCESGTDRLVELMTSGKVTADIWVNWQGDEPFITSTMINNLLQSSQNDTCDTWTLKKKIVNPEDITSPQMAKIVCNNAGRALYFSRSPIPFYREPATTEKVYYKHVGIYAFTTAALQKIASMAPSFLENAEKLEQLRFLQNNLDIRVHETDQEVVGIDFPDDVIKAEIFAKQSCF